MWGKYDGLNNVRPALAANLRYRFGLGRNVPWIRVEAKGDYADFTEARRSGWEGHAGLRGGVSLGERFTLETAYVYEHFAARDVVFDKEAHNASLRGTFEVTSSLRVALGYAYRYGDVNSYAVPPRPDIVSIADVLEAVNTFDGPHVAYRFPAETHGASIAISQSLNNFLALEASYEWRYTSHKFLSYTNHLAELGIALSF